MPRPSVLILITSISLVLILLVLGIFFLPKVSPQLRQRRDYSKVQIVHEDGTKKPFGVKRDDTSFYKTIEISGIVEDKPAKEDDLIKMKVLVPGSSEVMGKILDKDLSLKVVLGRPEKENYAALLIENGTIPRTQEWKQYPSDEVKPLISKGKHVVLTLATGLGPDGEKYKKSTECREECKDYLVLIEEYGSQTEKFFKDQIYNVATDLGILNKLIVNK